MIGLMACSFRFLIVWHRDNQFYKNGLVMLPQLITSVSVA